MESQVAGAVTAGLLAAILGCCLVVPTIAAGGPDSGAPAAAGDTAVSNDWDAGATDGTLVRVGVVLALLIGVGGGVAWYVGTSRRSGADETATTESQMATSAADASTAQDSKQTTVSQEPSDEERILELLEANDGQMKQTKIVENTDWSKSKVSMVLSEMESEGEISKLRVGRENLISLAGEEPEAAGSPFEDLRE
jgi:uncharacterized membrane protein